MFVDLVNVELESGKGGDGIVAFRREKYVPKGGPSGGDGGRGGHVIIEGHEGLSTLLDIRYKKKFIAEDGINGQNKKRHGRNGEDLIIKVPLGTQVRNEDGALIADIIHQGQQVPVVYGGRGGRGNVKFVTAHNTAPKIAEKGEPGRVLPVTMELKLLADVGLIGLPSAGKSTLISVISAVKPKIAAYPFTTLVPNLGMVQAPDGKNFVVADMPGLIEGASEGSGLGYQFLRHIERTRVLVHVVDMAPMDGTSPVDSVKVILDELKAYNPDLLNLPRLIAANKMDLPEAEDNLKALKEAYPDMAIFPISAYQKENLEPLLFETSKYLEQAKQVPKDDDYYYYKYEESLDIPFELERADDGVYEVYGGELERIFKMTVFEQDQAVRRFSRQLKRLGVDQALRDHGVQNGDTVRICGAEFDFKD